MMASESLTIVELAVLEFARRYLPLFVCQVLGLKTRTATQAFLSFSKSSSLWYCVTI